MIKYLFILLLAIPRFAFAETAVNDFFKGLEGKWHGELAGVYKVDLKMKTQQPGTPWILQEGVLHIEEGDEVLDYQLELSTNESSLDLEKVYFFKLKDMKTEKVEVYTYSHRPDAKSAFSFWLHVSTTQFGQKYETAKAVKLFLTNDVLTLGFVSGQSYCHEGKTVKQCATDGYRPFEMKKVKSF